MGRPAFFAPQRAFGVCVVADLQIGSFSSPRQQSASLKHGHYIQAETTANAPSPPPNIRWKSILSRRALRPAWRFLPFSWAVGC